nr:odorant receptor 67c-like [Onthophagus taurus]
MSTSALFIFGTQSLMSGLPAVELINVRIDHLADLLNVMMVEENNDIIWRKLRFCIMYHIHIIKLTEQVNTYYRPGTTLVIISFGIIVGSTLLAVFEDCTILTVACFFGIAGPVGVLCYSGQRMYQKSLAIGDTAFGLEWYNCNKKIIKDIQFLIMRTKKPLTFQGAWGLGEFTLETFGKLMSAGYKFTSLRTSIQQ